MTAFCLERALPEDVEDTTRFYKGVIERNKGTPGRTMAWHPPTESEMQGLIRAGKQYIVRAANDSDVSPIVAGVLLDESRDAWPYREVFDDGSILPDAALHFGKLAVRQNVGKGFGAKVVWPLIVAHADSRGYKALYCESQMTEGLREYYTRVIGMRCLGKVIYNNPYYDKRITAYRYQYNLARSA